MTQGYESAYLNSKSNLFSHLLDPYDDFFIFIKRKLTFIYKAYNFNVIHGPHKYFLAGEDLLLFILAYKNNDLSYLPNHVRLFTNCHKKNKIIQLGVEKAKVRIVSRDISEISDLVEGFQFNCFQVALDIKNGEYVSSFSFENFSRTFEAEVSQNKSLKQGLLEAKKIHLIPNIYFNREREISILLNSLETESSLSLFLSRVLITNNKKIQRKLKPFLNYSSLLIMVLEYCAFSTACFDHHFRSIPSRKVLQDCSSLVELEEVRFYIENSDFSLLELFEGLSSMYRYFEEYPEIMKRILMLFQKNNYRYLDKNKVDEIFTNKDQMEEIGGQFKQVRKPLNFQQYANNIVELVSPYQLIKEGSMMHHCLGSDEYIDKLLNLESRFFSVNVDQFQSTIEMERTKTGYVVKQHKMAFNEEANSKLRSFESMIKEYLIL